MRRSLLPVVFALTAGGLVTIASGQNRRDGLERQRQNYEQQLKALAPIDKHRMEDVLKLRVEDGRVALHTGLTPWGDFLARRADIEGLALPATVTYTDTAWPGAGRGAAIRQFDLELNEYPDPDSFVRTHLNLRSGRTDVAGSSILTIERTEQTGDSFQQVQFNQTGGRVFLRVFNSGPGTGGDGSFVINERDFAALRRRYARQVEQWLRPVLRDLKQQAAFSPDPATAWQVLADDWPLSPETAARVRALLPDLDSEQSQVRNRAADALARLGLDGATAILHLDRTPLSVEQNVRLDEVLSRFRRLPAADAARLRDDADFLLDCGYCDDVRTRALAMSRLGRVLGRDPKIDASADEATRTRLIESVRTAIHPTPTTRPTTQPATPSPTSPTTRPTTPPPPTAPAEPLSAGHLTPRPR